MRERFGAIQRALTAGRREWDPPSVVPPLPSAAQRTEVGAGTDDDQARLCDAMNGSTLHPDRPRDKMVARMQGVINQNYHEELAEKVSDALAIKVERGETVGLPPLGYRLCGYGPHRQGGSTSKRWRCDECHYDIVLP